MGRCTNGQGGGRWRGGELSLEGGRVVLYKKWYRANIPGVDEEGARDNRYGSSQVALMDRAEGVNVIGHGGVDEFKSHVER